jgi:hypothetical protein
MQFPFVGGMFLLYFIAYSKTRFSAYAESLGIRLQPFSISTIVIPNRFLYPYSHSKLLVVSHVLEEKSRLTPLTTKP